MNLRKSIGILSATAVLLAIGAQPMFAIGGLRSATTVSPASGGSFGAKLDTNAFPANAFEGQECPDPGACTRVMNRAYGGGTISAPKAGYVDKIKIVAGVPVARPHAASYPAAVRSGTASVQSVAPAR